MRPVKLPELTTSNEEALRYWGFRISSGTVFSIPSILHSWFQGCKAASISAALKQYLADLEIGLKHMPSQSTDHGSGLWKELLRNVPVAVLRAMQSRACRSAIMFNDELSRAQMELLILQMSHCALPFVSRIDC